MAYRQLRPQQAIEQETHQQVLSDRPLAIIARQSTTRQTRENLESLKLQVEDARQRFLSQGWSEDIITIRVAGGGKRGVSGTLRIDQRAELQDTIADIEAGKVKAVGAYSVSRLFRDRWGIQVGTFMEICAKYDVLVMLPNQTFDFNDPNDVTMFTLLARFAAVENEQRAKLTKDAKNRKSLRGEYDGRHLMVGFIVDRDKASSTYGHLVVYEPHARIVRRLYARYRELGGRFNLLAKEVARMGVVFPDFEEWVNKLDVSKMQLKRVPGGYHLSKTALLRLLTAIEYAGYWKSRGVLLTNDDGTPQQTHKAIVDLEDWQYAFSRLSWNTLTGEANTERANRNSWIPAGKAGGKSSLLHGILTSPLGTVQNTMGRYLVTELRPNHSARSVTLSVDARLIDAIFSARLATRLLEMHDMGREDFLQEQLAKMEQANDNVLVGVDEQIARYRNDIAGMQAYIKAVGAKADTKTLQDYNEQILDARANLEALEAKKKATTAKEDSMRKLLNKISKLTGADCFCSTEDSRRFIELACEKIELDEYSRRVLTLTITWRAPFYQTDVCYIYRSVSGHSLWSEADDFDLSMLYPLVDRKALLERFPKISWLSIVDRANTLGIARYTWTNTSGIPAGQALLDYELIKSTGWDVDEKKRGHHWLYDVPINDDLEHSPWQARQFFHPRSLVSCAARSHRSIM